MIRLTHSALSDKGSVREENEDAFASKPKDGIYLVSDGMGGEMAGEIASRIVSKVIPKQLAKMLKGFDDPATTEFISIVSSTVANLSAAVCKVGMEKPHLEGMGATLAMLIVRGSSALVSNIGDSRVYLIRDKLIKQLTKDHSVVQLLIDAGEISKTEAEDHPFRGQLLKCIGMKGDATPDNFLLKLKSNDRLLLCSDGLTDMLTDRRICAIVSEAKTPKAACVQLVNSANEAGGHDNITALVVAAAEKRKAKAGKEKAKPKEAHKS